MSLMDKIKEFFSGGSSAEEHDHDDHAGHDHAGHDHSGHDHAHEAAAPMTPADPAGMAEPMPEPMQPAEPAEAERRDDV
jgi:ABC-type Zn2+ transport system substrate-binding protein/surface adhesin